MGFERLIPQLHELFIGFNFLNDHVLHPNIDHLYVDMNSFLYRFIRSDHHNQIRVFNLVCRSISRLILIASPRKSVFFSFDGVAPSAKGNIFDASPVVMLRTPPLYKQIFPNSPFLQSFISFFKEFIEEQKRTMCLWKDIDVSVSESNERGEGEHKMFQLMRSKCRSDNSILEDVHCFVSSDNDTIFLSLIEKNPNILIFKPNSSNRDSNDIDSYFVTYIKDLRMEIAKFFNTPYVYQICQDFVFLTILIDSDYFGGINEFKMIYQPLISILKQYKGFKTDNEFLIQNNTINRKFFKNFLKYIDKKGLITGENTYSDKDCGFGLLLYNTMLFFEAVPSWSISFERKKDQFISIFELEKFDLEFSLELMDNHPLSTYVDIAKSSSLDHFTIIPIEENSINEMDFQAQNSGLLNYFLIEASFQKSFSDVTSPYIDLGIYRLYENVSGMFRYSKKLKNSHKSFKSGDIIEYYCPNVRVGIIVQKISRKESKKWNKQIDDFLNAFNYKIDRLKSKGHYLISPLSRIGKMGYISKNFVVVPCQVVTNANFCNIAPYLNFPSIASLIEVHNDTMVIGLGKTRITVHKFEMEIYGSINESSDYYDNEILQQIAHKLSIIEKKNSFIVGDSNTLSISNNQISHSKLIGNRVVIINEASLLPIGIEGIVIGLEGEQFVDVFFDREFNVACNEKNHFLSNRVMSVDPKYLFDIGRCIKLSEPV